MQRQSLGRFHQYSHVSAREILSPEQITNHHSAEHHLHRILESLVASRNNFSRLSCPIRVATFCTSTYHTLGSRAQHSHVKPRPFRCSDQIRI